MFTQLVALGRIEPASRLDHVDEHHADDHGAYRKDQGVDQRTYRRAPQFAHIAEPAYPQHQRRHHQRNDHHEDETQKDLAHRLGHIAREPIQ